MKTLQNSCSLNNLVPTAIMITSLPFVRQIPTLFQREIKE